MGRKSQQVGAAFESWIKTQHEIAEQLGILAHVVHNEPSTKMLGGRLIYVEATVADFTGTLDRGAVSFCAEAKSTKDESFARSGIEPKQQRHLEAVARAGGLALLLVEFRDRGVLRLRRFSIPWLKVPWKTKRTAESLSPEDIGEWLITTAPGDGKCYLSRFHAAGPRTSMGSLRVRKFARE